MNRERNLNEGSGTNVDESIPQCSRRDEDLAGAKSGTHVARRLFGFVSGEIPICKHRFGRLEGFRPVSLTVLAERSAFGRIHPIEQGFQCVSEGRSKEAETSVSTLLLLRSSNFV